MGLDDFLVAAEQEPEETPSDEGKLATEAASDAAESKDSSPKPKPRRRSTKTTASRKPKNGADSQEPKPARKVSRRKKSSRDTASLSNRSVQLPAGYWALVERLKSELMLARGRSHSISEIFQEALLEYATKQDIPDLERYVTTT